MDTVRKSALNRRVLVLGSFAMHASGAHPLTTLLDTLPMACLGTQILHALMAKAGHATMQVEIDGTSDAKDAATPAPFLPSPLPL